MIKLILIDYITYFNKNIYNETVLVSGLTTISETKADFIIPIEDKYKITVNYNTLKNIIRANSRRIQKMHNFSFKYYLLDHLTDKIHILGENKAKQQLLKM